MPQVSGPGSHLKGTTFNVHILLHCWLRELVHNILPIHILVKFSIPIEKPLPGIPRIWGVQIETQHVKAAALEMLLLFSCPIISNSLWPHGLQHARLPCPSPSPEVHPSSCPLLWWCHPANSFSNALFSFCPQSFPASETFPMSQLFASDNQNTGVSALASIFPMSIQGWFPLRLTGLISLLFKGLWGIFFSTIVRRHRFFGVTPSLPSSSHNRTWPLGRPQPWLYRPLSAEWCLCFSAHCVGFS